MLTKNNRVKEFYKKIDNGSGSPAVQTYYMGTDGQLVDMFSGLDLEQELKINGPSSVTITDVPEGENEAAHFQVVERYISLQQQLLYTVVTKVYLQSTDWILDSATSILLNSEIDGSGLVAQTNLQSSPNNENSNIIIITLYKGEYNPLEEEKNKIHTRVINLTKLNDNTQGNI